MSTVQLVVLLGVMQSLPIYCVMYSQSLAFSVLMAILPGEPDLAGFTDNWSYKTFKAPVKSSPLTNQHPMFCRLSPSQQCQSTEGKMWHVPCLYIGLLCSSCGLYA